MSGVRKGDFAQAIGQKLTNFTYTGIDISKKMIEQATLNHPQHTFYHIEEDGSYLFL